MESSITSQPIISSSSSSSSETLSFFDTFSPTAIQRPGQYCLMQDFEVLPFFSAPWNVIPMNEMILLQGTSSGSIGSSISSYINTTCQSPTLASDSLSAIYKVPRPRTDIITLRVPKAYTLAEVEYKWCVLDEPNCMTVPIYTHENMPGPHADHSTHKYYLIIRPVGVSECGRSDSSAGAIVGGGIL